MIIRSNDREALAAAAEAVKGSHSVLAWLQRYWAELKIVAEVDDHLLAVTATDLNGLVELTAELKK